MSDNVKICIVIPMYGKSELTDRCIALCRVNAGIQHAIIVVDDGSPEPYKNDDVNVIRLERNSGFTAAANAGILWCSDRYDYIHLMNNDTEPLPNFLKILYDVMETPGNEGIGIAGSARIVNHDGKRVYELAAIDLVSGYHTFVDNIDLLPALIHTRWFALASAMLRHEMIREIGLLDRKMRMWCSDNDYCIRANFADWNTTVVPASQVFHIHQGTTGKCPTEAIKRDQDVLMNKIMNIKYAVLCDEMPLDNGSKTYGKVEFRVYRK